MAEVLVQLCARWAHRNSTTTLASAVVLYLGRWAAVRAFAGTRVPIELLGCYTVCICALWATTCTCLRVRFLWAWAAVRAFAPAGELVQLLIAGTLSWWALAFAGNLIEIGVW